MKVQDFDGKYIRFTKEIEQQETIFETGMMARVVGLKHFDSEVFEVLCDFSMFEQYNRQFAHPNYDDQDGKATLFVWETKEYPKNLRDSVYTDETNLIEFEIIPDEEAMKITDTVVVMMSRKDRDMLVALLELDMREREQEGLTEWGERMKARMKGAL